MSQLPTQRAYHDHFAESDWNGIPCWTCIVPVDNGPYLHRSVKRCGFQVVGDLLEDPPVPIARRMADHLGEVHHCPLYSLREQEAARDQQPAATLQSSRFAIPEHEPEFDPERGVSHAYR